MSCHVERLLLRSLQRSNKIRTRQEITATRANQLAAPFYQPRRTARTKNNGWFTGHKISARLGHQNYLRHCLWFRCLHGCKASLIAQTAMRAKPDEQEGIKRPRPKASRHGVHSWPGNSSRFGQLPCSPPSKAAISFILFSLTHFNRTGGIRCTCTIPPSGRA